MPDNNQTVSSPTQARAPDPGSRVRLAELIASGRVPFPDNLSNQEAEELGAAVAIQRRRRLLTFVARSIALDIHHTPPKCREGLPDDL